MPKASPHTGTFAPIRIRVSSSDVVLRQPSHELTAGEMIPEDAAFRRSRIAVSSEREEVAAMAVRTVRQLGDPVLREPCQEVEHAAAPEIHALVEDLSDTLAFWRKTTGYGRGMAAPQIGVSKRVIFLCLPGEDPWPLVNPKIVERSQERIVVWDACLSFLSIFMQVERHRDITVEYQDLQGKTHEVQAGELRNLSELLQHEIDHLDGILCLDRVTDLRTVCTKEEFEKRYRAASPYATAARQIITANTEGAA
jgi:peptide deformylase